MKKYIVYIGILAVGLLLGWLLFGGSANIETVHNHDTVSETNQMWTCSMHPQIMQPESGDCPICGMDLVPASSSSEGLLADQFKLTENAMALANIQTTNVGNNKVNGNRIFSNLLTWRSWVILVLRSSSVVSSFIIGGWMIGTSAMYEYAATAIAPSKSGARREAT